MHTDAMGRATAVTVRIPPALKQRLETRARRERRSLSAQVAHELEAALARAEPAPARRTGPFLGLFKGSRIPSEREFREVRAMLWGGLPRARR
jgi:hypothetical protein